MSIVSVPTGNFTPGAKATLDFAAAVINACWDQANNKYDDFEAKIATIMGDWLSVASAPHVSVGTITGATISEPNVVIPTTQSAGDILTDFETEYGKLVSELVSRFTSFRTTYFGSESDVYGGAETWLKNAIANPNSAIPAAVAAQILTDDRDRITAEATRATDALLTTFASRRFPLPSGAAASATTLIQQNAQDEIAESSRKLVMNYIQQMNEVVTKSLSLRQLAMDSAVKYISTLAAGPQTASQVVGIGYDAQSKLIEAASQFYNSRIAAAELTNKVSQFNATTSFEAASKNQVADLTMIEDRLKALLGEAQMIGSMATSMFNNLHANSGSSYSVSA